MTEGSSIMAKICNINFWIENDPLPLLNFSEVGFPYLANVNIFLIDTSVQHGIYLFVILPLKGLQYSKEVSWPWPESKACSLQSLVRRGAESLQRCRFPSSSCREALCSLHTDTWCRGRTCARGWTWGCSGWFGLLYQPGQLDGELAESDHSVSRTEPFQSVETFVFHKPGRVCVVPMPVGDPGSLGGIDDCTLYALPTINDTIRRSESLFSCGVVNHLFTQFLSF